MTANLCWPWIPAECQTSVLLIPAVHGAAWLRYISHCLANLPTQGHTVSLHSANMLPTTGLTCSVMVLCRRASSSICLRSRHCPAALACDCQRVSKHRSSCDRHNIICHILHSHVRAKVANCTGAATTGKTQQSTPSRAPLGPRCPHQAQGGCDGQPCDRHTKPWFQSVHRGSGVEAMVHASIAGEPLLLLHIVLGALGLPGVALPLLLQPQRNEHGISSRLVRPVP